MEYLLSEDGGGAKRFFFCWGGLRLSAHHQQDPPRLPHAKGSRTKDIEGGLHTPFGYSDYQTIVANIENSPPVANGSGLPPSMAIPTYRSTKGWLTRG